MIARHLIQPLLTRRAFVGMAASAWWVVRAGMAQAAPSARTRLFTIRRSKNANIVCYDWVVPANPKQPAEVDAYWEMHTERGQREELTLLERNLAYGFQISGTSPNGDVRVSLKAAPRHPVLVTASASPPQAWTQIAGQLCRLDSIFVQAREGGVLPAVLYIDLRGHRADGSAVSERVRPGEA